MGHGPMRAILLALALAATPALSQESQPAPYSALEGVVVDSLRGGFASAATISVAGTSRYALTDSLGRFRVDSIPAGRYRIELSHEILDTLGVAVRTHPVTFAAGSSADIILAIPSAKTIVQTKCGTLGADSAALMGVVLAADSEDAIEGAEVRLSWIETTVGIEVGMRREPRVRSATTDAAGRYRICGLPRGLEAELSAKSRADSTAVVGVRLGAAELGMASLLIPLADPANTRAKGATVRGVVTDSGGLPVAGARVALAGSAKAAVTDSAGTFTLDGQSSGTQSLTVRRIGYRATEIAVNLSRTAPRNVVVRLDTYVPTLQSVFVNAQRNLALQQVGFTERQRQGLGRHLTLVDLEKRHAIVTTDLIRHLPPARASGMGNTACTHYWVDGMRWQGDSSDVDGFVAPSEVAAIEVYSEGMVPAEFQSFERGCRVVVVWTKWKLRLQ